jgi:hypothetical protein
VLKLYTTTLRCLPLNQPKVSACAQASPFDVLVAFEPMERENRAHCRLCPCRRFRPTIEPRESFAGASVANLVVATF